MKRVVLTPFDKHRFKVVEDYRYKNILIPAGFVTNGANIPRIFWSMFPPNKPEYLCASVVHDYLCEQTNKEDELLKADEVLCEMMLKLGCSKFKSYLFMYACKLYHIVRY